MTRVLKAGAIRLCETSPSVDDDALRRAEVEQAYAAGLDDGLRQGREAGGAELARLAGALPDAIRDAAAALAAQRAADAHALVTAGLDVARWILERELSADTGAAADRVTAALAELPGAPLRVRVNPALVDLVPGDAVEGDPALAPGEAVVDLPHGSADLTFGEAFRRAADALGAGDA